jgi:hypothetical protein
VALSGTTQELTLTSVSDNAISKTELVLLAFHKAHYIVLPTGVDRDGFCEDTKRPRPFGSSSFAIDKISWVAMSVLLGTTARMMVLSSLI